MYEFDELKTADAEIAEAITKEMERQNSQIQQSNKKRTTSGAFFYRQVERYAYPCHGAA